jgi:hypothetical protein
MTIPEYAAKLWADKISKLMYDPKIKSQADKIEKFKILLQRYTEIGITGKHKCYVIFTDYHAGTDLEGICIAADLESEALPIQSYMQVYPDKIQYKFGYGQPIQTITLEEIQKS